MDVFEINIQRKDESCWPVVVERPRDQGGLPRRVEGILNLDLPALESELLDPRAYGRLLGEAVFRDRVRDEFLRATQDSERLHVLVFVEDVGLQKLRWEWLCAPAGWDFLALNQQTPFCLYLPSATDRRFAPFGRSALRALILSASPAGLEKYNLKSFDAAEAARQAVNAFGDIPCDVLADSYLGSVGRPCLDDLCKRIIEQRYPILHVICHGERKEKDTVLYLCAPSAKLNSLGEPESVETVTGSALIERLGRLGGAGGLPHFVFLGACETAMTGRYDAIAGLAQRMVRDPTLGVPAVLAMTDIVQMETVLELTKNFYRRLYEHGEPDFALAQSLNSLNRSHDLHVPALYSRLGGRPLFSDGDRSPTVSEITSGIQYAKHLLRLRAPVLQSDFELVANSLQNTLTGDRENLTAAAQKERDQAVLDADAFCAQAMEISFTDIAFGKKHGAYDARCPYRGLYAFRPEDDDYFFGREKLIDILEDRVSNHRFLAILGPSGSGKSSLVMAGLIPRLKRRQPVEFRYTRITPGRDPIGILNTVAQQDAGIDLLIVDQFEELFTNCTDPAARRKFADELLDLNSKFRIVVAMRADFWGECADLPRLKGAMKDQELVGRMTPVELRSAGEQQASKVGLKFEAGVGGLIFDEVGNEPGAMPLLQHALQELWKRRHGRWLLLKEYNTIGGVGKAIAETAEGIYRNLPPSDQARMRHIFCRLTRLGEASGGDARDTRQTMKLSELTPAAVDVAEIRRVIKLLADEGSRLLVSTPDPDSTDNNSSVELAHEALIRHWPRFKTWLSEDRQALRTREGVREAAQVWKENGKRRTFLAHSGHRLNEASKLVSHSWIALSASEVEYIKACRVADLQLRWMFGAAATTLLALVLLIPITIAVQNYRQAAKDRDNAARQTEYARAAQNAQARAHLTTGVYAAAQGDIDQALLLWELAQRTTHESEIAASARNLVGGTAFSIHHLPSDGPVYAVAMSGDGSRIVSEAVEPATIGKECTMALWDATTSLRIGGPTRLSSEYNPPALAMSRDGRWIATGSDQGLITVTDAKSWQPRCPPWESEGGAIRCLAISADGGHIATGSDDGVIRIWSIVDVGHPVEVKISENSVESVSISSDGSAIAGMALSSKVAAWDAKSRTVREPFSTREGHPLCVSLRPDGGVIAIGRDDGLVSLCDFETGKTLRELDGHRGPVMSVAICDNNARVCSGSVDKTVRVWDADTGYVLFELTGCEAAVASIGISSNGDHVVAATGRTAIVWQLDAIPCLLTNKTAEGLSHHVEISPDTTRIVTGGGGTVNIWDGESGKPLFWGTEGAKNAIICPGGTRIALQPKPDTAEIYDTHSGQRILTISGQELGRMNAVAVSEDTSRIVIGNNQGISVWDNSARFLFSLHPLPDRGDSGGQVAVSPNGSRIVTDYVDAHNEINLFDLAVWDGASGNRIHQLHEPDADLSMIGDSGFAVTPDGHFLVTLDTNGTVKVRKIDSQVTLLRYTVHPALSFRDTAQTVGGVARVAASSNALRIVTAFGPNTIRVWDGSTGAVVNDIGTGQGEQQLKSVAITPDGSHIVGGFGDGTWRLWRLPAPALADPDHADRLRLSVEVRTAKHFGESEIEPLSYAEWMERRKQLDAIGGSCDAPPWLGHSTHNASTTQPRNADL